MSDVCGERIERVPGTSKREYYAERNYLLEDTKLGSCSRRGQEIFLRSSVDPMPSLSVPGPPVDRNHTSGRVRKHIML